MMQPAPTHQFSEHCILKIVASIMHITVVIITCVSTCAFYVLYYCLVIEHELGLLDIINMVATLGSGGSGGSVYIMDMSTIDSATVSRNAHGRIERVASFDRTVWTADCNSDGTQVVLGTNTGAGLLNLETGALSWLYRCKSDILSQQFVHSGNVVLCGLRNGSIVPVDVRERHSNHPTGRSSPSTARGTVPMLSARHNARGRNQADKAKSSRVISMPSAVCSLVSLSSDEHYFLASSMDGSVSSFLIIFCGINERVDVLKFSQDLFATNYNVFLKLSAV
ncbi:hypothetical protein ACQJBY_009679 [Aegilops geniculata]